MLHLVATYLRLGLLNELAYRVNFWIQLFETTMSLLTTAVSIGLVFRQTDTLGGWDVWQLITLIGVYYLTLGLIRLVIAPSFELFLGSIRTGALDFLLTKPVDAQLLVSISEFRVFRVGEIALGLGIVVLGSSRLEVDSLGWVLATFVVAMILGLVICYCFWLILCSLSFWFVRIENIMMIFWSVYGVGRWPITIYPRWLRIGIVAVVPVAFAVTVPAEALTGLLKLQMLGWAAAVAALLLVVSRVVWRFGLRRYSGASA